MTDTPRRPLGPNMKKLIFAKMGKDAVPDGGGVGDAIKFLTTPGAMSAGFKSACEFSDLAILAVRMAAEPNPFKNATEEEIAGEILRKIEDKRKTSR